MDYNKIYFYNKVLKLCKRLANGGSPGNSCTNVNNIRVLYNYTFLNAPFMMTFINIQEKILSFSYFSCIIIHTQIFALIMVLV